MQRIRCAFKDDPAALNHKDAVRHVIGGLNVVCHDDLGSVLCLEL